MNSTDVKHDIVLHQWESCIVTSAQLRPEYSPDSIFEYSKKNHETNLHLKSLRKVSGVPLILVSLFSINDDYRKIEEVIFFVLHASLPLILR